MNYLADTSAWTNMQKSTDTASRWAAFVEADAIIGCEPVTLELLRTARNLPELRRMRVALGSLRSHAVDRATWERAADVMTLLAVKGQHRGVSNTDLLVAAAAEQADVTLLHYDKDFDLIAEVTGQPMQWIAPRGTL